MGRATIAPVLTRACEHHLISGGMLEEEQRQACRELRALKAVARAAKPIVRAWGLLSNPTAAEMERFRKVGERVFYGYTPSRPTGASNRSRRSEREGKER